MDDFDDEPCSLPCSNPEAKVGLPVIVQLHLADAGLEKNPYPREDFYRQFSITPERQTPEEERTPPPPIYSRAQVLKDRKDWATVYADSLKKFHAGRVMLRKFEAEQHGVLEEDPDFWSAQAKNWQVESWSLIKEMAKQKKRELKGEAEQGYAQAMLLSPLQSPSPLPLLSTIPKVVQHLKPTNVMNHEWPEINGRSSQPHEEPSQELSQRIPEHDPSDLHTLSKAQKRKRSDDRDQEDESPELTGHSKRQRREMTIPQGHEHELASATKMTQEPDEAVPKVSRTKAYKEPKRHSSTAKTPLAQPTLPWSLRSREVSSFGETSSGRTIGSRVRRGKKDWYQKKTRRYATRSHGRNV